MNIFKYFQRVLKQEWIPLGKNRALWGEKDRRIRIKN